MVSSEPSIDKAASGSEPVGLSFGDGFQFGCGFFAAGLVAGLVVLLILMLIGLLLSLTGVGIWGNLFGGVPMP
jgi:hypothetical protein